MKIKTKKKVQRKKYKENYFRFFVLQVTAREAVNLLEINLNSAALFYRKIHRVITYHLELQADKVFDGSVGLDKSCLGGQYKGKRGNRVAGKVTVFGILKRIGKVFTIVVEKYWERHFVSCY